MNNQKKGNQMKSKRGITLIALVITIIILLILASISIKMIADSDLIGRANEAKFKTRMAKHDESTKLYTSWKIMQTMNTDTTSINSGDILKTAIENQIIMDIEKDDVNIDINEILKDLNNAEKEYLVVYKCELHYVSDGKRKNDEKYRKWCEEINIPILENTPNTGIVVRNSNYELVKGVYLCTPKLDVGFVEKYTRYLNVDENGKMVPGNWIYDKPSENWYSYKESEWANIVITDGTVENGAIVGATMTTYYTWIPMYAFMITSSQYKQQTIGRTEVRFIEGTSTEVTEGYQIPEAFTFNGLELPGYWIMKYTAGE